MKKIFFTSIIVSTLFSLNAGVTLAGGAIGVQQCNNSICATITSASGNGSPATASIKNNGSTARRVTFSAYKIYYLGDNDYLFLSTQTLSPEHTKTISLSPGETQIVTINTPDCATQIDVILGEALYHLDGNNSMAPLVVNWVILDKYPVCSSCTDECSTSGQKVCSNNSFKVCGNYDADSCKEWGPLTDCALGEACVNGSCVNACTDECFTSGQRVCDGDGFKQCGNYDSDSCLEWGGITRCAANEVCSNGSCALTCTDECVFDQHQCSGNAARVCGKTGNCTRWGNYQECDSRCYRCGDNRCECGETKLTCPQDCGYNAPAADLSYTGEVGCNRRATLNWTSTNADSCAASGSWSGAKAVSGSETVGNFIGSRTYTITCAGPGGSASDTVVLNGTGDELRVSAGGDKYLNENDDSVRLDGSVDGDYDYLAWTCTGGSLSDGNILRPEWRLPFDYARREYTRTYNCTLTARNECGADSDTMRVNIKRQDFDVSLEINPDSGCIPLENADLAATVSNYGSYAGDFTYYFDCDNDGDWEKTVTVPESAYTAKDLCDYKTSGFFTARVKVVRGRRTATATEIIRAETCAQEAGRVSIAKTVRNLTRNTDYLGNVTAAPGDSVSYKIIVSGVAGTARNVRVTDSLPPYMTRVRDLAIDGEPESFDLASGANLGEIPAGQTRVITYTATVDDAPAFDWGQTVLTNTATVYSGGDAAISAAVVYVWRQIIKGATKISTGLSVEAYAGLGVALAGALASLGWLLAGGKRKKP